MNRWSDGVVESWSGGSIRIRASLQYSNIPIPRESVSYALRHFFALCPVEAQPRKSRIGYLNASVFRGRPRSEAFRQGLRELGYVEGKNIIIEFGYADGKFDRLPSLVSELIRLKVNVIITAGP